MKIKSALTLACVLLISFAFGQGSTKLTPKEIYQKYKDSVVSIETGTVEGGAAGSGFFFQNSHTVITCYHVIKGATSLVVKGTDGVSWTPNAVAFNETSDTALLFLKRDTDRQPFLSGLFDMVEVGDPVCVIGDPLGLKSSLSTGVVGAKRESKSIQLVQLTAPISEGSSGSPLIDEQGRAIGFVSFTFSEGQNLNMAVAINSGDSALKTAKQMPLDEFLGASLNIPKNKEEAQHQLSADLGQLMGQMREAFMRWQITWLNVSRSNNDGKAELQEALDNFFRAVMDKPLLQNIGSCLAAAELNEESAPIAEHLTKIETASKQMLDAELKCRSVRKNDRRLEQAGRSLGKSATNFSESFVGLYRYVTKLKGFDSSAFWDVMPASVVTFDLLDAVLAIPDPDIADRIVIKDIWEGSKLLAGDVVVAIRSGKSTGFKPITTPKELKDYVAANGTSKLAIHAMRNGTLVRTEK